MIIKYPKAMLDGRPEVYDYIEAKGWAYPIYWMIDWKLRKSVKLVDWLEEQIKNASEDFIKIASEITNEKTNDKKMTDILRWVEDNITYRADDDTWKMPDYWQTIDETLKLKTGDCEDGAILTYCLAVLNGVPANRLLIFCGDVDGGGHCWLGYRPDEYPLNWCFMDWCYWFDRSVPNNRTKYYIKDNIIYDDPKNQYYKIWFGFNHLQSYKGIMNTGEK